MSTLRIWNRFGSKKDIALHTEPGGCVDIIMDDGRTYQMHVQENGDVFLRCWGNNPNLVGNGTTAQYHASVPFREPTTDEMGNLLEVAPTLPPGCVDLS
jgi:hypothetical protein